MPPKQKGLGRGLEALLGGNFADKPSAPPKPDTPATLPIVQLQAGKYQPRTRMDEASIAELATSITAHGVIQPILVRAVAAQAGKPQPYEIIAGERRFRAAIKAGLSEVPVVIRNVPDQAALAMALIENIQREDLNALEEAQGIERLIKEFNLTHEEAAQAVGKSRSATSNLLRLLQLPRPLQDMVYGNQLTMGHARALLPLDAAQQLILANQVIAKNLSVRQAETLAGRAAPAPTASKRAVQVALPLSRDLHRFTEELCERFGTTVLVKPKGADGKKGGKLVIEYSSHEHLDDLLARFK